MDATTITTFDRQRIDELVRMWRESFEHGVGIVDTHPLEEQRQYFVGLLGVDGDLNPRDFGG